MASGDSEDYVRSFARGLRVIEAMGRRSGPMSIAELTEATGLPRSAVRRFVMTLSGLGYIRSIRGAYSLTPRVLRLGMSYLHSLPAWRNTERVLEDLCAEVSQSCAMSVLDGDEIVYVARVHTRRILSMSPVIGSRLPAYAVSMGRVLLAELDDDALADYLQSVEIVQRTAVTTTDRAALRSAIEAVRTNGYAWVDRQLDDSICGIAVPVRGFDHGISAAINVSLPAGEFDEATAVREFLSPLRQAAAAIRALSRQ
ncbi:IclR family transcriptional regulator domain-containing protein [Cumulibacter manganitolerans]|uniref:IclR family transcriptional regulator domain-containing protein n=1 Tax=Cumulibacter manganitolerans TaxID=1884992 RepID=UPI00129661F5|nr:IclR family transcriptional regulator C-terminal domain-containing protein [Cumulibacter manganitolerans]